MKSIIKFDTEISSKTIESLYLNLIESKMMLFDNIVYSPKVEKVYLYKGCNFLNVALPTKFIGAYDPCTDFIYINMTRIKNINFFNEVVNHEIQHKIDFNELTKTLTFEEAIEEFEDPIYETKAIEAQKLGG